MRLTIEDVQRDFSLVDEFIEQHKGLVSTTIKKNFPSLYTNSDYEDIVQTAYISFYKAIIGYNADKGVKFRTYAITRIVGGVRNHLRDYDTNVSLSVTNHMRMNYKKYYYLNAKGKTLEEIACELGMSILELTDLITTMNAVVCFDDVVTNNDTENEMTLHDVLPDKFDLQEDTINEITLEHKKLLIKKYVSPKHHRLLMLAEKGFKKAEICRKLKIKLEAYDNLAEDIRQAFEYINAHYEQGENIRSVIFKLSEIRRGEQEVQTPILSERGCIDTVKQWAINNPGKSIKVLDIVASAKAKYNGSANSIKEKAIKELKKEGYTIKQTGNVYKLIDNAKQEVASTIIESTVAEPIITKEDLFSFTKEVVSAIGDNYGNLKDTINTFKDKQDYNFKLEDRVVDTSNVESLLNTIKTMCELANASGKKIQATILLKEIN